jgi:hypothetical protein
VLVCVHWKVTTFAVLQMWIKSLPGQGVSKDIIKLLTVDAFERVITILERYTGASKDPIPQINATKVVQDELQWTDSAVSKLLPLIYAYWLNKRNQMGKPLCRKYWPQITSADTNPRQVFRCVLFAVWSVVVSGVKADAFSFWCVDAERETKNGTSYASNRSATISTPSARCSSCARSSPPRGTCCTCFLSASCSER